MQTNKTNKNLQITIFLNIIITISQLIGGIISNSLALISDALHNFSDVISLIISFIANKLKYKKPATQRHTFGYKRAEIIAAFINSFTLIIVGMFILKEGIENIFEERTSIINAKTVIILSIIGIFANAFSTILLHKESKNNLNIKSSYLHLLSDTLTSVGVLIGGILMSFYENLFWIDSLISVLISIYLIYHSIDILRKTLEILMQFTPKSIDGIEISKELKNMKGIKDIFHIHIWRLDEDEIHFEARIIYYDKFSLEDIFLLQKEISNFLLENYNINHVTLQPEKDSYIIKKNLDHTFLG